jgi:hypothetical protein
MLARDVRSLEPFVVGTLACNFKSTPFIAKICKVIWQKERNKLPQKAAEF